MRFVFCVCTNVAAAYSMNCNDINLVMLVTIGYTISLPLAGAAPERQRVDSDRINLNHDGRVRI